MFSTSIEKTVVVANLLTYAVYRSRFLTEALRIFGDAPPLSLAATRTAHLLSTVMLEANRNDDAELTRERVYQALEARGKRTEAEEAGYSQDFFDSFVLFRHL